MTDQPVRDACRKASTLAARQADLDNDNDHALQEENKKRKNERTSEETKLKRKLNAEKQKRGGIQKEHARVF